MMYEAPNTVMIDDLNEFVQYPYNDKEDLQTRQEVLACILVVEYDTNHCNKNPLILMRKSHRCVIRSGNREIFGREIRTFIILQHISLMEYLEDLQQQNKQVSFLFL